ncbi:MAG: PqqD family protein [Xanthomonadales bacterium]|jgi:hypothetical protein|nr:PqqD family protein [Xanthomonadales bacterium]
MSDALPPADFRLQVDRPRVSDAVFEEEVMLLDLHSGHYFSLTGSGARLWPALAAGHPLQVIADAVARIDAATPAKAVRSALQALVAELHGAGLVRAAEAPATGELAALVPADLGRFEAPQLHRFTDMEELLAIDPLHEVDERGWPHFQAPAAP